MLKQVEMGKSRKWLRIASVIFLVVFIGTTVYLVVARDKPPLEELKEARMSITRAKNVKADEYAKSLLKKSVALYDSAMNCWGLENQTFFLFRNYDLAREYARRSVISSEMAIQKSGSDSKTLDTEIAKSLLQLQAKVEAFQQKFEKLPIDELKKQNRRGRLLLGEARIAYEKGDLKLAKLKVSEAKVLIEHSYNQAATILANYFNDYFQWRQWAGKSIIFSEEKREPVIIIDKYARTCFVYQNGAVKEKFEVELGKNWMGNKLYQGDQATPEGNYKIIAKKENHKTRYNKALLINYPNGDDEKRFFSNKKNGIIKSNSKIGNLIEIHGAGGQGIDWTDGCIALKNEDMDKVFAYCKVGTPVVIIGSLKNLSEITE